ncbi:uncharacterized protein LOC141706232 [Apium graveolens]|uniref:uncharacterized protein LOC141706232 n=1 Tax=Apium graveolens TaxID=4045 RepID=UPI003D7A8DF1
MFIIEIVSFLFLFLCLIDSMDSSVTIYIHHHGDFEHKPKPKYVGGDVEVIPGFDPDLFLFRDLDDFAVKCGYAKSDLVYFKNDGLTFESGMRLLYDDSTVRAMVDIHKPIGKINLYIDHYDVDEVIDNQEDENDNEGGEYGNKGRENENQGGENGIQGGEDGNEGSGDDSDPDDPEYGYEGDDVETESDESEDEKGYDSFCDSDEELREFREKKKKYKDSLKQNHGNLLEVREKVMSLSDESEYASDELRSDSSSSEDENHKIGYVGPPNPKIKKRKRNSVKYGQKSDTIKWEVGMKFASMAEFRDAVRQYGVMERRGVQFIINDAQRCQVSCEAECKFYIWCSKDKDSDNCTIKTLFDEHNCSKPYTNKLASVKYLTELYGDRIRKNPQ